MSVRQLTALPLRRATTTDRASVDIYKPFFLAGILCVLTVGCLLGAVALFGIGQSGSYTSSAWAPYILAHANSQVFGWVGFFVMGFALQQHVPTVGRVKLFHRLAWTSLVLMAVGIAMRFVAEPMVAVDRERWLPVGVLSGILQALSVTLFVSNIGITRHRTGGGLTWQTWFVFGSLFWLLVVSMAEPIVFAYTHQSNRIDSVMFIARWYPVLREAQFLGFVAMMIFGVSLVKLHSCFGAKEAIDSLGKTGFVLWILGLSLRMFGWLHAFGMEFSQGSQIMFSFGGVILTVAAVILVSSSRIFEPLEGKLRSHKFVRSAFAWLLVSGLLLILEPLHLRAIGAPFSHAFTGAIRHALTVGFISQMILGFGAHVVARMNGLDERKLPSLASVFILLNVGNTARVGLEIATDYTKAAYLPMGATGFVELIALGIWAYHVARPMLITKFRRAHA